MMPHDAKPAVCLWAPRCGGRWAKAKSHSHPQTRAWLLSDGLFFNARPLLGHPVLNETGIPFSGLPRGFLTTPTTGDQNFPYMRTMIRNVQGIAQEFCHPAGGPQLRGIAVGRRALEQKLQKGFLLRIRKFRRTPRSRTRTQSRQALGLVSFPPFLNGLPRHFQFFCDRRLTPSLAQQANPFATTTLKGVFLLKFRLDFHTPSYMIYRIMSTNLCNN